MKWALVPCLIVGLQLSALQFVKADEPQAHASASTIPTTTIEPGERPLSQIDRDIDAFMARVAQSSERADRNAAIQDLCGVLEEVKRDPRLPNSEVLQGYKAKLVARLNQLRRTLDAELAREARQAEREAHRAEAQRRLARGSGNESSSPGESLQWVQQTVADDSGAAEAMASQFGYLSASSGGGSSIWMRAGGHYGGGAVASNANDLIELIQRTIKPEHWDVNGGPGTIFFYQPLNALVIRASTEIHSDVGTSLDELRRAGGR